MLATLYFVEEILDYVHENADEVRSIVAEADAAAVVGDSLALRAVPERSAAPVRHPHGRHDRRGTSAHRTPAVPAHRYPVRRADVRVRDLCADPAGARTRGLPGSRGSAGRPDAARGARRRPGAGRHDAAGCGGVPHRFGADGRAAVPGPQRADPSSGATSRPRSPRNQATCWRGSTSLSGACCSASWSRSPTTASRTGDSSRTG